MYTLDGAPVVDEGTLNLPGYRGSVPVRKSNRAGKQLQICSLGGLLETAALFVAAGHVLDLATRALLADGADRCAAMWEQPDAGIWELEQAEHYTFSKICCWAGLDRAVSLAARGHINPSHAGRWRRERDRIRDWVDTECWSEAK